MSDLTIERPAAETIDVSSSVPPQPARAGIPLGITAEQLEAAKRVLEAEVNKARSGQAGAGSTQAA